MANTTNNKFLLYSRRKYFFKSAVQKTQAQRATPRLLESVLLGKQASI